MRKSGVYLNYIVGYVASKKNLLVDLYENDPELSPLPTEGELLNLVLHRKLSHLPTDTFDLSIHYCSFFTQLKHA